MTEKNKKNGKSNSKKPSENKNLSAVSSARAAALNLLLRVEKGGYSNLLLDNEIKRAGDSITPADRALLTALVYGVTERKITLDYIIDALSSLPPKKIEPQVRNILRLGIYQLFFLDKIPSYAAVNECVSLAEKRCRGFVNAVLREFCRRGNDGVREIISGVVGDDVTRLSVAYSFPIPLIKKLSWDYPGRLEQLLSALNRKAPLCFRVNTLLTDRNSLISLLKSHDIDAMPSKLSDTGIYIDGTSFASISELPEFNGLFFVQDEASQLCTAALGAKPGERIIDACSCPGSKSFGIAIDMNNDGRVFSFDLHENKLSLVVREAARLGINIIETEAVDGRVFRPELEGTADRVLCDVPCSGIGVIAKKPEIRYKDITLAAALPSVQLAILNNNAKYVKAGGTLVYSTCTLFKRENEDVIAAFLAENNNFFPVPFQLGTLSAPSGMLTLAPDTHDTDGFFIAKLSRHGD